MTVKGRRWALAGDRKEQRKAAETARKMRMNGAKLEYFMESS
jgi:hypothetical protein